MAQQAQHLHAMAPMCRGRLQLQNALIKKAFALKAFPRHLEALTKPQPPPPVVDELSPAVVQELFATLVEDPAEELALRRDLRRADSHLVRVSGGRVTIRLALQPLGLTGNGTGWG